jgi:GntR family transcriptional regulator
MNILSQDFTIDHNSKLPLHVQVEELFRKLIKMEVYKKGALLPKEVDLANLWEFQNTIRQATNKLENEGLIIRKKGIGTRVAEKKVWLQDWIIGTASPGKCKKKEFM